MRTHTTVTIGTEPYAAQCPVPRPLGFFPAIGLTLRGWIDAVRNRGVPDTEHTHTLWWLQSGHRRIEKEVVRRVDTVLARIDVQVAGLDALIRAPRLAPAPGPARSELDDADNATRAAWARADREARAASVRDAAAEAERARAEIARAELLARRDALQVEADDVCEQWRESYGVRAARYTRARFTRWGRPIAQDPAIAPYDRVGGTRPRPGLAEVAAMPRG